MLVFSPLASAPLGGEAPRLPQILAQAASAMALGGVGAARAGISARKQSGTAADLPLGGHAQVQASVRGQGLAGLPLAGVARGKGAIGFRLQSDVPLMGAAGAQARVDATASDTLDLRDAAWSAIGVQGSAVTVFGLQRHAVAAVEVDVTAARSLPLVGHSAARLHGRGTAATTVVFGITASGNGKVLLRSLGDFALDGLAQSECKSNGALLASLTTAGAGVLDTPAAGRGAGGLAIEGGAGASSTAVARAEASVSVVGAGTSDVSGDGAGAISLSLSLRADGRAALGAFNDGEVLLSGLTKIRTSIAAQAWETGLSFTGQAAGTILQPREGSATGELRLNAQAQAVSALKGHGIGAIPLTGHSTAASTTRIVFTGQLSLTRGLSAELQVTAKAGRTIALAGAGRAALPASARAQALSPVIGGRCVAGAPVALSVIGTVALSGASATRGEISARAQAGVPLQSHAFGVLGARATLASAFGLSAVSDVATGPAAQTEGLFAWQGSNRASTATIGGASPGIGIAGTARAVMITRGTARSTIAVARAFVGDVDVFGDSTRQIRLGGSASAGTTTTSQTSEFVVDVTGRAKAHAAALIDATVSMALVGVAENDLTIIAAAAASIGWRTQASATAPRSAQSRGTLSLVGKGLTRSTVDATAGAGGLAIDGELAGATALTAGLSADAVLNGAAEANIVIAAQGTGQVSVARDSDAEVQVAGDAARVLSLAGTAAGALAARATRVDGAVELAGAANARAQTAARLFNAASPDLLGHTTGAARMQAICSGRVAFVRLGQADVLVAAGAAHGMTLLGTAFAGNVTRATANLPLEPQLSGTATNVIRVEFVAREVAVAARGNAMLGVSGRAVAQDLGPVAAVQALRAPPALRRSEPPKYGLSGRLMSTNSGRILRG